MENYLKKCTGTVNRTLMVAIFLLLCLKVFAQCITNQNAGEHLKQIEQSDSLTFEQKIEALNRLRSRFDDCKLFRDSVYGRIFNRIGFYQFKLNNEIGSASSIRNTLKAIEINKTAKKRGSRNLALNCYKNVGVYYTGIFLYFKALDYLDTSILIAHSMREMNSLLHALRLNKISIYLQMGDYQKAVEESTVGLAESHHANDSLSVLRFLSQRSLANFLHARLEDALSDADKSILFARMLNDDFEMASAVKIKAQVSGRQNNFLKADALFKQAINLRMKLNDVGYQLADDYTDYGNYFLNERQNYTKAVYCYNRAIHYATSSGDAERMAKAHLNLGVVSYARGNYGHSLSFYMKALEDYKVILSPGNLLQNPVSTRLGIISNKEVLLLIFGNKTEVLVALYKQTKMRKYLSAALQTAQLTDTLISEIRHEQMGELSKLYWRKRTRDFFSNAIEACFLDNNATMAFLFMEKSRAVLLGEKLNEIGAAAYLPESEASTERQLQIRVITARQTLNSLNTGSTETNEQLLLVLAAKDTLEHYINSLNKKFPVYYQYKYEDNTPSLAQLQKYLSQNKQSFVHYFINDSVAYVLSISPVNSKIIRLSGKDFTYQQVSRFTQICAESGTQNLRYDSFASLSNTLYKSFFKPLQIAEKRVIICPDNLFIPFEALCTDPAGEHFLVNDYAFSYVYSARYLFKLPKTYPAEANFIGFAPEIFQPYLDVAPLAHSAKALEQIGKYYKSSRLFTNEEATKERFLKNMFQYSIVNLFSHAYADTGNNEPLLYMHDSVIHLSELQSPIHQAARLVVLSACQTNVGRSAAGEGIYSLARGFASAGIPSIAATCWEADQQATYEISLDLHGYISQGLPLDVALQKVKLEFLEKHANSRKVLPYYWANMVIIGNSEPIKLLAGESKKGWIAASVAILGVTLIIIWSKKRFAKPGKVL